MKPYHEQAYDVAVEASKAYDRRSRKYYILMARFNRLCDHIEQAEDLDWLEENLKKRLGNHPLMRRNHE